MLNALRLSMEVLVEVLLEVLADVAGRTKLEARVKIQQPKKLKVFNSLKLFVVLLVTIRY